MSTRILTLLVLALAGLAACPKRASSLDDEDYNPREATDDPDPTDGPQGPTGGPDDPRPRP